MQLWFYKMISKLSFLAVVLAAQAVFQIMLPHAAKAEGMAEKSSFRKARPLLIPGESPHLYLVPEGLSLNPFVNDMWGDTDKLLTGGANLRHLTDAWGGSLHSSLNWRFFVPDNEPKHGRAKLDPAPGHYADWLSLQSSWARTFEIKEELFKLQLTGGLAHIGEHGAAEVHSLLHSLVGADKKNLSYEDQPTGYNTEYGAEFAWIPSLLEQGLLQVEQQLAIGESRYKVLSERWVSWNGIYHDPQTWTYGLELRYINQFSSETFQDYLEYRHELTFGIRFSEYYSPNILYVSPYVKGDNYGQIYISLFSFNIPL